MTSTRGPGGGPLSTCCIDRMLITGASPAAANKLGKLAATTLLQHLANDQASATR